MKVWDAISDEELATLLKNGSVDAYTEIYNRFKGVLYMHAFNKMRNREDARDVVQEVFSILWNKREVIVFQTTLAGYLYASVRNKIINMIAHQDVASSYIASFQHYLGQESVKTDYLVREKQLKALIELEIAALPPKMRVVFELSRKANLSHKEVAEELQLSEKTVKKQVNNALKILRSKLGLHVFLFLLINY